MFSPESRTYVTTTTNRWVVAFLSSISVTNRDAKLTCLKLVLKGELSKSQINTELQQEYRINKRQANSIIAYVEGAVKSAKECRSNHLELLQGKLKHVADVIKNLEKKIASHRKYLQTVEQVNRGEKKRVPKSIKPRYPDACPRSVRPPSHLLRIRSIQTAPKEALRSPVAFSNRTHQEVTSAHHPRQPV